MEPSATIVCGLKPWQAAGSFSVCGLKLLVYGAFSTLRRRLRGLGLKLLVYGAFSTLSYSCMGPSAPYGGDGEVLASRQLLLRLDPVEPAGLAVAVSARAKPVGVALHSQLPENAVYKLSRP
jgi:hypothetical protein